MHSIILYFSLIITLFQGAIYSSNELYKNSKFVEFEKVISKKPLSTNNDFQNSIFIIDEENDDEVSCFKNKLLVKKLFILNHHFSKLFLFNKGCKEYKICRSFYYPNILFNYYFK